MKSWFLGLLLSVLAWSSLAQVPPSSENEDVLQLIAAEEFDKAAVAAAGLVEILQQASGVPSADLAVAQHNLGYVYLKLGRFEEAEEHLNKSIELREEADRDHGANLVATLSMLARLYSQTNRFNEAHKVLRRAQYITHLNDGVFTLRQLPIVERIIGLNLADKQLLLADQQQRFYYLVNENNYSEDDTRLLPALAKLSDWYRKTAQFQNALGTYEKTITLIENQLGDSNVALAQPLRDLSSLQYVLAECCPAESLDRAVKILTNNPETDTTEKLEATVRLADVQTMVTKDEGAGQIYRRVWQMLSPDKAQEMFNEPKHLGIRRRDIVATAFRIAVESSPGHINRHSRLLSDNPRMIGNPVVDLSSQGKRDREKRANVLIGSPLALCYPQILQLMSKPERQTFAGNYVSMEFSVDKDGRVSDIQVVDSDAPSRVKAYVRNLLNLTRYRPRLENGEPVLAEHVTMRQTFESHDDYVPTDAVQDLSNLATYQGCNMVTVTSYE
jgi:tetratricopeptide (TPR) repeat protein